MTNDALRKMIREERKKRRWSQLAVAYSMGWAHNATVANYESGHTRVTLGILRRYAELFDMDLVIEFRPRVDERVAALEGK